MKYKHIFKFDIKARYITWTEDSGRDDDRIDTAYSYYIDLSNILSITSINDAHGNMSFTIQTLWTNALTIDIGFLYDPQAGYYTLEYDEFEKEYQRLLDAWQAYGEENK